MPPVVTGRIVAPAPNRCPADPEEIAEAYIMGTLTADDAAAFEDHYITCSKCAALLGEANDFVRAMNSGKGTVVGAASVGAGRR